MSAVLQFRMAEDIESNGVNFLRFDALLVVNKVEAAVREIRDWIVAYEEKNGVSQFVLMKKN